VVVDVCNLRCPEYGLYDVNDPFWGQKLIDKVAENILSALKNPEEATFKGAADE